ncbi:MAG: hypothetical protein KAY65_07900 [Planctomycetes bacterium]|nr:hypothetical protein [Planctomycetota bacterium]
MKRAVITVAAVVVLVGATEGWAGLVPVNSNSVIEDGIEYYIHTDKAVYDFGEDVGVVYRITNLRDEKFRIRGLNPIRDIVVAAEKENNWRELWKWSWFQIGPAGPVVLDLEAGEATEISYHWPQTDLNGTFDIQDDFQVLPGTYRVSGVLHTTHTRIDVDIAVIPEPGSFVLLCGGAGLLRVLTRTRGSSR